MLDHVLPDYVATVAGNPDDGSLCLKCNKTKASMLSSVHSVSWHVDVHDIPVKCHSMKIMPANPIGID